MPVENELLGPCGQFFEKEVREAIEQVKNCKAEGLMRLDLPVH